MHAMVLNSLRSSLQWTELPDRQPGSNELRVRITACGVCRTDLHVVDGELPEPKLPIIPGHEIVGRIDAIGPGVEGLRIGERVGIPWLGHTCGVCPYCSGGAGEPVRSTAVHRLHPRRRLRDGHHRRRAIHLPPRRGRRRRCPRAAALCRPDRLAFARYRRRGQRLGLYGFGAAAHIVAQVAQWQGRSVFAFTRPGDVATQAFARRLGATWAGGSDEMPPEPLDAAIIFATVGDLVPLALQAVRKGGRVVCAGIHMSDIPAFPYRLLWEERQLVSVANLTRLDGIEFLRLAPQIGIVTEITRYPLDQANQALADLRGGRFEGAAVLLP